MGRTRPATAVALLALLAFPTSALAEHWGSNLAGTADVTKSSTVNAVYWTVQRGGVGAGAPHDGQVSKVTIKGHHVAGKGDRGFKFKVLRRQAGGKIKVIATSQGFELPDANGTYTFKPTHFLVEKGDFLGISTIGGDFRIARTLEGATTNDFRSTSPINNGVTFGPTTTEASVELAVQAELVPLNCRPVKLKLTKSVKGNPSPVVGKEGTVTLDPQRNLIKKSQHHWKVAHGTRMTYVLTVKNIGDCPALDVKLSDDLPSAFKPDDSGASKKKIAQLDPHKSFTYRIPGVAKGWSSMKNSAKLTRKGKTVKSNETLVDVVSIPQITKLNANAKRVAGEAATGGGKGDKEDAELRQVQIAVLSLDAPGCTWLKDHNAHFKTNAINATNHCAGPLWLPAVGTDKWSFAFDTQLPKGRYEIYARAVNAAGVGGLTFDAAHNDVKVVTVE
jgi:uncharacterized repeat protein (TIGR01451 family)